MKKLTLNLPTSWETSFETKNILDEDGVPVGSYESTVGHEVNGLGVVAGITLDRTPGYSEVYEAAIHDAQQYLDYLEQLDMPVMFIPECPEEYLCRVELAHCNHGVDYFVEQHPQEGGCIIHLYTLDDTFTAVYITVYVKDWHDIDEALGFLNEHLTVES